MRSGRTAGHELLRLLAEVSSPLYLLDEQRRIVFLNQAASDWVGALADALIGRPCRYQSSDADPVAALANSLCPPPEVFHGQTASAIISKPTADGSLEQRCADFIPLPGDSDHWVGVLVLVQAETLAAQPDLADLSLSGGQSSSASSNESRTLHDLLASFRRDTAQWHQMDRLVGKSPAIQRVREQIKLAAAGNSAVLIVGPPGIGRQHVARTIHFATSTHGMQFPISCSALPPDQLQSTISLFCQRIKTAGATGPTTLLLTDVDRLPSEGQSEIIRWLDSAPSNVQVVSTALERLEVLASRGSFRADLAQRLGTLVIELPPLADRRDDIPLLAQMFLEELNAQGDKQLRGFASEAMDRLYLYDWPGQVDELATVIRQAFSQAEGFEITPADLPKQLRLAAEAARHPRPVPEIIDLEKFLTRVESELIERALRQSKGNKSQAARLLGITRPRLYRRMVQLGMASAEEE